MFRMQMFWGSVNELCQMMKFILPVMALVAYHMKSQPTGKTR